MIPVLSIFRDLGIEKEKFRNCEFRNLGIEKE
jgi:hypothetical protein